MYDSDKYEFVAVSDSTITPGNTYVVTVKEKEEPAPVEGVIWIIIKDENDTLVGSSNMYDISEIDTNEDGQLTEDELSGLYDSDKYEFVAVSDSTITPGNTYVVTVKEKEEPAPVEGVIWIIIKDENDTLVGSSNMYDISEIDTNEDGQLTEDELSGLYDRVIKYEFVAVCLYSTITPGNTYVVTVKEKEEPAPVEGVIWIIIKDENDTLVGSSNMYDISEIDTNEDGQLTEDDFPACMTVINTNL